MTRRPWSNAILNRTVKKSDRGHRWLTVVRQFEIGNFIFWFSFVRRREGSLGPCKRFSDFVHCFVTSQLKHVWLYVQKMPIFFVFQKLRNRRTNSPSSSNHLNAWSSFLVRSKFEKHRFASKFQYDRGVYDQNRSSVDADWSLNRRFDFKFLLKLETKTVEITYLKALWLFEDATILNRLLARSSQCHRREKFQSAIWLTFEPDSREHFTKRKPRKNTLCWILIIPGFCSHASPSTCMGTSAPSKIVIRTEWHWQIRCQFLAIGELDEICDRAKWAVP